MQKQQKKKSRLVQNRINSKKNPTNVSQMRKEDISHDVKKSLSRFLFVWLVDWLFFRVKQNHFKI